jgi:hypothetical protein
MNGHSKKWRILCIENAMATETHWRQRKPHGNPLTRQEHTLRDHQLAGMALNRDQHILINQARRNIILFTSSSCYFMRIQILLYGTSEVGIDLCQRIRLILTRSNR